MTLKRLLVVGWLCLALAGCQPVSETLQSTQSSSISLQQGDRLGQTFTANFDGLSAIGLIIRPLDPQSGAIRLTLARTVQSTQTLRSVELPVTEINSIGITYFFFPPLADSNQADFFLEIEHLGKGRLDLAIGDGASYLDGSLYRNETPVDSQMAFQLIYGWRYLLLGLVQEAAGWLAHAGAALLLFVLPGWFLSGWLLPGWLKLPLWSKVALASSFSLAVYPLLLLWSNLLGLQPGAWLAWIPPGISLVGLLLQNWRKEFHLRAWLQVHPPDLPGITLAALICLILISRFWAIRNLTVPLWGDSYQHSLIGQLLVEQGGLFRSWQPYSELASFSYHFGFHSLAAAFSWVTGLAVPQSTLWVGQWLNVLATLCLYPLARRTNDNPWAGVMAVFLAGLVFPMPAFFLNWGRYSQLAGMVLLAGLIEITWELLEREEHSWKLLLLAGIGAAGLALSHYRVALFAVLFPITHWLLSLGQPGRRERLWRCLLVGLVAALLMLPWVTRSLAEGAWSGFFNQLAIPASQLSAEALQNYSPGTLSLYLPAWAWFGLVILSGYAIWKHRKNLLMILLWWLALLLAANPNWLGLPGSGLLTSFAVLIAAYLPASLVLGASFGWLSEAIQRLVARVKPARRTELVSGLVSAGMLVTAGLLETPKQIQLISPAGYALTTRADLRAFEWIQDNLPVDSKFLVNAFFAYEGSAIVGSDAGWWLPLLAKRETNLPPLLYLTERGPRTDYPAWVNQMVTQIHHSGLGDSTVLNELKRRGIEYLFIGQRQGLVNTSQPLIKLDTLINHPGFELVYHQDRVWIFQIRDR